MSDKRPANWFESLETRRMLSAVYPTDLEQYVIELINRARANPAAEAARDGIDLNEGLAAGTISSAAKQPLAVNPYLVDSSRKQSQWMINNTAFSHTGAGGSNPNDRMKAAGYVFTGSWSWAENIALRSFKTNAPHADVYEAMEKDLFTDIGIADRGHRVNLLSDLNNEVGVGAASGKYSYYNAAIVTQDFASSGNSTFLTGVAYTDTVTKDNFYTPGEGLGGVTITATRTSDGAVFTTKSWAAGGYSLKLGAGTYKVSAAGGALAKSITYDSVTIGQANVKRDFTSAGTVATTPPPPTTTPPPPVHVDPPPAPPGTAPDKSAPTAGVHALRKRSVGDYYRFTVTFSDHTSVLTSSLGAGDIQVKGAGGYVRTANFVSVDSSANGKTRTATYEVKGPHGVWNRAHNGVYTIWVAGNQVRDTNGNYIAGQQVGAFTVRIPKGVSAPLPAPAANVKRRLVASDVLA
jgi:uncharacterized protein YkwD